MASHTRFFGAAFSILWIFIGAVGLGIITTALGTCYGYFWRKFALAGMAS